MTASALPANALPTPPMAEPDYDEDGRRVVARMPNQWGEMEDIYHEEECLGFGGRTPCRGPVMLHSVGTGYRVFPRCDAHQEEREAAEERRQERYPDSPVAPSWFSAEDAGERWDDEP